MSHCAPLRHSRCTREGRGESRGEGTNGWRREWDLLEEKRLVGRPASLLTIAASCVTRPALPIHASCVCIVPSCVCVHSAFMCVHRAFMCHDSLLSLLLPIRLSSLTIPGSLSPYPSLSPLLSYSPTPLLFNSLSPHLSYLWLL